MYMYVQVSHTERRVSARGHKKLNGTVETSPQKKKTVSNRKAGRKRKAEDSSSYMISNYLDKEVTNSYQKCRL